MPFKKRVYRKRTTRKPTLARQVAVIKKTLRLRKPEVKHYGVASLANVVDNDPSLFFSPLRSIIQGDADYGERVGDKLRLKNFNLRTSWLCTGVDPRRCRMIIFSYKNNPDGVISSWSTIINLYLSSAYANTQSMVTAYKDWDNNSTYHTLYDKTRLIQPQTFDVASKTEILWDVNIKLPMSCQEVHYGNNGVDITHNEFFVAFIQEYDNNLTVNYQYRLTYTDI